MKILLYVIFYLITGTILGMYIFKEKIVVNYIDNFIEKSIKYLKLERKSLLNSKFIKINTILFILITSFYLIKIDYSYDSVLSIRNKVVIGTVLINVLLFVAVLFERYYLEYIAIVDILLIVFGVAMFGIDDKYFYIYMYISSIFSILLIYLGQIDLITKYKKLFNAIVLIILVLIIQVFYLGNYVIPTGSMIPTILVGDRIFANNIIYKFVSPSLGDIIAFKEPLTNKVMYTKRITGTSGHTFKINENDKHIYIDGQKSNLNREYSVLGLLQILNNPEIYIPKKGDEVKLEYILEYDLSNQGTLSLISKEEFLSRNIPTKYYPNIFGIWSDNNVDDKVNNKRYTYILSAKGKDGKVVLPILDFKYSTKTMEKLLNGEYITLSNNYYMAMGDNTNNSNDSRFFGYVKESRIYGKLLLRWLPLSRIGRVESE